MSNSIEVKVVLRSSEIYARVTLNRELEALTIYASQDGCHWNENGLSLSLNQYPELSAVQDDNGDWNPNELAALLCPSDLEMIDSPIGVSPVSDDTQPLYPFEVVP